MGDRGNTNLPSQLRYVCICRGLSETLGLHALLPTDAAAFLLREEMRSVIVLSHATIIPHGQSGTVLLRDAHAKHWHSLFRLKFMRARAGVGGGKDLCYDTPFRKRV